MLQIQLGRYREVNPATDPLGRAYVGLAPDMTPAEAWEAGRGVWKLDADRVLTQDEAQIVDNAGIVLCVARIYSVVKYGDRRAVTGVILDGDQRVGQPTTTPHPSRNSIAYV